MSLLRPKVAIVVGALLAWMAGSAVGAATFNVLPGASIQEAINSASDGDEIVLEAGTYWGSIAYGGKNITIRGQGVTTILDAGGIGFPSVVSFMGHETRSARLEQVMITGVKDDMAQFGGIYIDNASPTISNCTITGNACQFVGGGICVNGGSPAILNCTITRNTSRFAGGGIYAKRATPWIYGCVITGNSSASGGGVATEQATNFTLQNCRVANNSAISGGGGLYSEVSTGAVTSCAIESNTAGGSPSANGGGARELRSVVTYSGNVFKTNWALGQGGGIQVVDTRDGDASDGSQIRNNVFVGNYAAEGGAVSTDVGDRTWDVIVYVRNNTFFNNASASGSGAVSVRGGPQGTEFSNNIVSNTQGGTGIYDVDGQITLSYNCFWNNAQGSYGGGASEHSTGTDLFVDPRFVNAAAEDFHLQSNNAHWHRIGKLVWNTAGHWAKDNYTSPCIDAGAPTSDFSNEPAPNGMRINMGRYGNTAEASKISYWKVHTPSVCSTNVSRVQTIVLEFLRPMDEASVESKLSVSGPGGSVPGTIAWLTANRKAEFTPDTPWLAATQYEVKIASGAHQEGEVENQGYGFLTWDERFVFTTGSGPAPTAWTPTGTGVARDTNISVTFDADMNQASVQAGFRTVPATTGTFSWVGRTMTYNPNGLLASNRTYTYTVDRNSQTTGGAKLGAGFSRSFTTGTTPTTAAVAMVGAASTVGGITSVTISLTAEAAVSASVLNLAGREVAVLPSRSYEAGLQTLLWDGRSLAGTRVPGGRYLIRLEANTDDGQRASCLIPLQR